MRSESVTVGYVHDVECAYSWHASMMDLVGYDLGHDQRVIRGGWIGVRYGTGGIVGARNMVAQRFLADDRADWLFWIDTDMGFATDTVDRLLDAAHPDDRPVVGALCFANREIAGDGMGGFRTKAVPTIYYWSEDDDCAGFRAAASYPDDTLMRCSGTGSACVLVHRSVFERIGGNWYNPVPNPMTGLPLGEDLSFCVRLGAADIPVHVHTGVKTTHLKPIWLSHDDFMAAAS